MQAASSGPGPGRLRLLYFAWLRERLGTAQEEVALPERVATVGDLLAWQRGRGAAHAAAFAPAARVRCAVNQEFAAPDAAVTAGDEVAFFPPVTGG
jgi:molybdopterin converting factor subunit 1